MFKKIAAVTAPFALLLSLTACGGPMSAKDTCSSFNSLVSSVSGASSSEDSKKVAGQLEDLSDRAPDSMKGRITDTAEALRKNAGPNPNATVKGLQKVAVDMYIAEFKDVCASKS